MNLLVEKQRTETDEVTFNYQNDPSFAAKGAQTITIGWEIATAEGVFFKMPENLYGLKKFARCVLFCIVQGARA